ncbi:hypothetical protein AVEN_242848-1 [Araneus ventricosus]|uniref:Uncharacterized protein n=1 Tax=Araneus ventricosus TaxID=182803 RepID=A0A4Y2WKS1_ARAVE|nr:hypothetical protein AVEN_229126-1 [Araneus ventricosus]GBO36894.1 hypothetical protein AVEN_70101-1 [Araneus ventricosus]GBO36991.1 hypothetical protein AVEN_84126-1 [Araneus ventricosus]GBO37000.1 hypothetical protein AVEN_242848-1 [Araneus ventricosus]
MSDSDESDLDDYFPSSSGSETSEYDALCWGWLEEEGYEKVTKEMSTNDIASSETPIIPEQSTSISPARFWNLKFFCGPRFAFSWRTETFFDICSEFLWPKNFQRRNVVMNYFEARGLSSWASYQSL